MITQSKIAKATGASQQFVSMILNGSRRPSWRTAKRLIQAVPGTTIELWMEGTPDQIREAIRGAGQPEQQDAA